MKINQTIHWYSLLGIITMLCILNSRDIKAQFIPPFVTQSIAASPLQISEELTTNLIFPQAIKSVDRGSRDILVQKANEVENILQIKAENKDLTASNLTVITTDGQFYSFVVSYKRKPELLNLTVIPKSNTRVAEFPDGEFSEPEVLKTAQKVAVKNRRIKSIRQRKFMTGISLDGIYIDNDLLYLQLKLENQTNISYDIEQFRFFIRDNREGKRTASQELEQVPVQVLGNIKGIPAQSTETVVVALDKFTIPDQKYLGIELMEHNGGRNLHIKVKNHHIINAAVLDE